HRGDQQRRPGGHAVDQLGGRGVRELVRRAGDRRRDRRADLRHRRPVRQAAGHLPGQPQPGPRADAGAVAGHGDRGHLQRGREHRLPLVPVPEHHPAVPVRVRAVVHEVLVLQPEGRCVQRQRLGDGDRDGHQYRVGGGGGRRGPRWAAAPPPPSQDPPEQLAGFQRTTLTPGQSATVSFPLTVHDLASWSAADNAWEAQAGTYAISVGDSSASLPLTGSTSLAHELTGQIAAGSSGAGVSLADTAVSANVTPNSGVPGAETVGVVNPFGYSSPKGAPVSFPMSAVDPNSAQTLTFPATGLPPGTSIASNGTISGAGSTLGTYTVTVTA